VHRVDLRLRDDGDTSRFGYVATRQVRLAAGQNFVVDFDATAGGFVFENGVQVVQGEERVP
jgi:hypothetical protein